MQRDLFSAYLALQVTPENKLDLKTAELDDPVYLPTYLRKRIKRIKTTKKEVSTKDSFKFWNLNRTKRFKKTIDLTV